MKMVIFVVMHMNMNICILILMSIAMHTVMNMDMKMIIIMNIRRQKRALTATAARVIAMDRKATVTDRKAIATITAMKVRPHQRIRTKHFCSICWIIIHIMLQNWIRWHRSWLLTDMKMRQNRSAKLWTSSRRVIFT